MEMHERRRRSLAPSAADEEDRLAEQSGATAALGPDIASAILNGTRSPSSRADVVAPSLAQDERGRSQSTASTTLGPSSDRSALTSPPKAHLRARSPASTSPPPDDALPRPSSSSGAPSYLAFPEPPDDYEPPKRLPVERIPRNAPVLTEQYRYDAREGIVRPYRSHRCRHCAAVVLSAFRPPPLHHSLAGSRAYARTCSQRWTTTVPGSAPASARATTSTVSRSFALVVVLLVRLPLADSPPVPLARRSLQLPAVLVDLHPLRVAHAPHRANPPARHLLALDRPTVPGRRRAAGRHHRARVPLLALYGRPLCVAHTARPAQHDDDRGDRHEPHKAARAGGAQPALRLLAVAVRLLLHSCPTLSFSTSSL